MSNALIETRTPGPLPHVPPDILGQRFDVLEALGDPADIIFLGVDETMQLVQSECYAHAAYDGVGAALRFLERRGTDVPQPMAASGPAPGRFRRLLYLFRFLDLARRGRTRWALPRAFTRGRAENVTVVRLDQTATRALIDACRAKGERPTPALLLAADQSFAPGWLKDPGHRTWSIAMNMRGAAVTDERAYGNFVAALLLNLNPDDDAHTIERRMNGYRRRGLHWGGYLLNRFMLRKGKAHYRARQEQRRSLRGIFGVFTNLGRWDAPALEDQPHPGAHLAYTFVPPLAPGVPFGVALMTVNERLCFSFTAHPSLGVDEGDVNARATDFARRLDEFAGTALHAQVATYSYSDIAKVATGPRIEAKPAGFR